MERKEKINGSVPSPRSDGSGIETDQIISKIERLLMLYEDNETLEQFYRLVKNGSGLRAEMTFKTPGFRFELPEDELNLKELEKEIVNRVLAKFEGNKSKTAEYLCISRSALRSKL